MKDAESARSVVEAVASNPKVVAATIGSGFFTSAATNLGVIQGWLSVVSMGIATLTGLVVLVYHVIKTIRLWREWQDGKKVENDD